MGERSSSIGDFELTMVLWSNAHRIDFSGNPVPRSDTISILANCCLRNRSRDTDRHSGRENSQSLLIGYPTDLPWSELEDSFRTLLRRLNYDSSSGNREKSTERLKPSMVAITNQSDPKFEFAVRKNNHFVHLLDSRSIEEMISKFHCADVVWHALVF